MISIATLLGGTRNSINMYNTLLLSYILLLF